MLGELYERNWVRKNEIEVKVKIDCVNASSNLNFSHKYSEYFKKCFRQILRTNSYSNQFKNNIYD